MQGKTVFVSVVLAAVVAAVLIGCSGAGGSSSSTPSFIQVGKKYLLMTGGGGTSGVVKQDMGNGWLQILNGANKAQFVNLNATQYVEPLD